MLAQPLVLLAIAPHHFSFATLQGDADLKVSLASCVVALKHHVGLAVTDDRAIVTCRNKTAAHTQVIDGIEHIGLALPIVAYQAIELGREIQLRFGDVLVVDYGGCVQCHRAKVLLFTDFYAQKR